MTLSNLFVRKGLAWMLCLCMVLTLLSAAAPCVFAEGESYADGVYQGSGEGRFCSSSLRTCRWTAIIMRRSTGQSPTKSRQARTRRTSLQTQPARESRS